MSDSQLTVKRLSEADYARWDDFVRSDVNGTFYHLCGWQKLIANKLKHRTHYMYAESDGRIVGVLPLARVRSWLFGDALISVPFLVYGGVVANNEAAERSLIAAATELADELNVDYLELRSRQPREDSTNPAGTWQGNANYVTFRKAIDSDPQINLQAVPRKQRAMIRKGIKHGLIAERDENTGRLYDALIECKRNLGTPFFPRSWLQAIKDEFGESVEITTIVKGRSTVASVMSFRFRDEILPYYGGGGALARDFKGNDFMYWAVMEKACQEGVSIFDFGRSSVGTGPFRFKKHWGFEPEPLHYRYYLAAADKAPELSPSNPRFDLAIRAWKKLPLGVAGILGPPIARRLG